jgi:predicted DCC family thiol-disulfide oxidoreductase YuxK
MSAATKPRVTVWFDGGCPLCTREIALYQRLDARHGRIRFVDLTGDASCPLDRAALLARFHAQENDKPIVDGAAAFAALWRHVTPFQPLGWLGRVPPMLWLMERAYRGFLRIRPRLQRMAGG